MIKYLYLFLALWCLPHNNANAVQVLAHDGSFQIAAAVKLGRGGNLDVGLTKGGSVIGGVKKNSSGGKIGDTPTSCNAGYYISGKSCKKCPGGTYSDGTSTVCTDCPPGTAAKTGQAYACGVCPEGTYASGSGNTTCTPCPAGQYTNKYGMANCTACDPGTYQPSSGQTSCDACPTGKYAAGTGNTYCEACPAGTYTNTTGTKSCTLCGPGTYNNKTGQTACTNCPQGMYADSRGNTVCTDCPKGTYASTTGQKTCTPCPAGKYVAGLGNLSCLTAPSGNYAAGTGNTDYTACPKGTYQVSTGKGYCDLCPAGKYQDETGKSSCKDCPSGTSSTGGALACSEKLKNVSVKDGMGGGVDTVHYTSSATSISDFISKLGDNAQGITAEKCSETDTAITCHCTYYGDYYTFGALSGCRSLAEGWNLDPDECNNRFGGSPCPVTVGKGPYRIYWRDYWDIVFSGLPADQNLTYTSHNIYEYANILHSALSLAKTAHHDQSYDWDSTKHYEVMCNINDQAGYGFFRTMANCNSWKSRMGSGSCTQINDINGYQTGECKYKWTGNGATSCPAGQYSATGNTPCTQCPEGYYCTGGTSKTQCPSGQTAPAGSTSSSACVNKPKTIKVYDSMNTEQGFGLVRSFETTAANAAAYEATLPSEQNNAVLCTDYSDHIRCNCVLSSNKLYFGSRDRCNTFKDTVPVPGSCADTSTSGLCNAYVNIGAFGFMTNQIDSLGDRNNTSSSIGYEYIMGRVFKSRNNAAATCSYDKLDNDRWLRVTCRAGTGLNGEKYFWDATRMGQYMANNQISEGGSYDGGMFSYYAAGASQPCPAGTYSATGSSPGCTPCPAGKFGPNSGRTYCENCSAGTYSTVVGSTTHANCWACPSGQTSSPGSTSCSGSSGSSGGSCGQQGCAQCETIAGYAEPNCVRCNSGWTRFYVSSSPAIHRCAPNESNICNSSGIYCD